MLNQIYHSEKGIIAPNISEIEDWNKNSEENGERPS